MHRYLSAVAPQRETEVARLPVQSILRTGRPHKNAEC